MAVPSNLTLKKSPSLPTNALSSQVPAIAPTAYGQSNFHPPPKTNRPLGFRPCKNCTYAANLPNVTAPTELHQVANHTRSTDHVANNAFATRTKQELVSFLHASYFSPMPSTLLAAINAGNFSSWLGFTSDLVKKHLPKSQATIKGHL
jgi:hypothetical protein